MYFKYGEKKYSFLKWFETILGDGMYKGGCGYGNFWNNDGFVWNTKILQGETPALLTSMGLPTKFLGKWYYPDKAYVP